jgi:hypothetical protein
MSNDNNTPRIRGIATARNNNGELVSLILPDDQTLDQVLNKPNRAEDGDRFGTGGQHVARELSGKTGWADLDNKGPDPEKNRNFLGDEFQGMLGYDASGKPAFWSHFSRPDGSPIQSIDDLKGQSFKICLASKMPEHLVGNPSISDVPEAWGEKEPKDAAVKVAPRMEAQIRAFAKDFEKVTGLKMEIVDDAKEANLTVMAWETGTKWPRLLGFASFPESMNSWSSLDGLGNKPAFMFVSNDYANLTNISDQEVRNLFSHEFGHNMGWCHPHDLARLNMSQAEALGSTLMAYSDMHNDDIAGSTGAQMGAIDYTFRKWFPDAPALNTGDGRVYDLQKHLDMSWKKSQFTSAYRRSGQLSTAVIVDAGTNTELHGTKGNDFLDTNTGYASYVTCPDGKGKQKFMLSEGHIAKVKGIAGDNVIIPSKTGDQVIEPGTGNSQVKFYHQGIGGNKTIVSEGKDTLVLSESILLGHKGLHASEKDGHVVIGDGKESITLAGKGVATIQVIDAQGREILSKDVAGLGADAINQEVITPARAGIAASRERRSFTERLGDERSNNTERSIGA